MSDTLFHILFRLRNFRSPKKYFQKRYDKKKLESQIPVWAMRPRVKLAYVT